MFAQLLISLVIIGLMAWLLWHFVGRRVVLRFCGEEALNEMDARVAELQKRLEEKQKELKSTEKETEVTGELVQLTKELKAATEKRNKIKAKLGE